MSWSRACLKPRIKTDGDFFEIQNQLLPLLILHLYVRRLPSIRQKRHLASVDENDWVCGHTKIPHTHTHTQGFGEEWGWGGGHSLMFLKKVFADVPLVELVGWLKCCFMSTETVGLLGTGVQDVHLGFHTAPEWEFMNLVFTSMPDESYR